MAPSSQFLDETNENLELKKRVGNERTRMTNAVVYYACSCASYVLSKKYRNFWFLIQLFNLHYSANIKNTGVIEKKNIGARKAWVIKAPVSTLLDSQPIQ